MRIKAIVSLPAPAWISEQCQDAQYHQECTMRRKTRRQGNRKSANYSCGKKHEEKSNNCLYKRGWSIPASKESTKRQSTQPNTQHTIDNAARTQEARTNQSTNQNPTTHIGNCEEASNLKKRQLKPGLKNKYAIRSKHTSSASEKLRVTDTAG